MALLLAIFYPALINQSINVSQIKIEIVRLIRPYNSSDVNQNLRLGRIIRY